MEDSVQLLRHDLIAQARTITALVEGQREINEGIHDLQTDKAVRAVDRKHLDERLGRIEKRFDDLVSVLKWILLAIAASFITAIVTFVVKGGLTLAG